MKRTTMVIVATLAVGAAAVAAPATATARGRTAVGPTVVGLWHLDEPAGSTTMSDSSGRHNDGAISGDVETGLAGVGPGYAYGFVGPASIVTVPSNSSLNPGTSPLTVSAYLKVPAGLGVGDYNVLQKGQATASGGAYKMEIDADAGSDHYGFPDCEFHSGGMLDRVYGPGNITDGQWHRVECHLTATEAYAAIDGVSGPVKSRTVGSIANSVDLTLGGKPNLTHFYVGMADEVSITIG